jgi:carbohydrate-binding DOMON domain-containing protein
MTYSKTHQRFADRLNNQRALEHPEDYLGSNWKDVLNFWWFLDGLSEDQWEIVRQRYRALGYEVRAAAGDAAGAAAYYAAGGAAYDAWAGAAAYDAVQNSVAYAAALGAAYATSELIGSHRLLEQGKPLTFLPLFLNLHGTH